jgi:membrane-associated phospholipid phosphatase
MVAEGLAPVILIQEAVPWLATPMYILSLLGSAVFYFVLVAALYWCRDPVLGLRAGMLLGISSGVNDALKIAFHSPRPYWVSRQVTAYAAEPSFGFPSAHAQLAAGFWGIIAARVQRGWFVAAAMALVLSIGLSRVVLGVHFVADVVAGWLIGLALLLVFLRFEPPVRRWIRGYSVAGQLVLLFLFSLLFPLFTWIAQCSTGDWEIMSIWVVNALAATGKMIYPLTPSTTFISAGMVFGLPAGAVLYARHQPFRAGGSVRNCSTRFGVGIFVLALIWFGWEAMLPANGSAVSLIGLYLRSVVAGMWISAGAPAVFTQLGLTE